MQTAWDGRTLFFPDPRMLIAPSSNAGLADHTVQKIIYYLFKIIFKYIQLKNQQISWTKSSCICFKSQSGRLTEWRKNEKATKATMIKQVPSLRPASIWTTRELFYPITSSQLARPVQDVKITWNQVLESSAHLNNTRASYRSNPNEAASQGNLGGCIVSSFLYVLVQPLKY